MKHEKLHHIHIVPFMLSKRVLSGQQLLFITL